MGCIFLLRSYTGCLLTYQDTGPADSCLVAVKLSRRKVKPANRSSYPHYCFCFLFAWYWPGKGLLFLISHSSWDCVEWNYLYSLTCVNSNGSHPKTILMLTHDATLVVRVFGPLLAAFRSFVFVTMKTTSPIRWPSRLLQIRWMWSKWRRRGLQTAHAEIILFCIPHAYYPTRRR